jgi:RNA-binding protein YlmH
MKQSSYEFEEITQKLATYTLVQNFLSPNQIMNNENIIFMALVKTINHLDFSKTKKTKNVIIPHYFLECLKNPSILAKFQYQDIA